MILWIFGGSGLLGRHVVAQAAERGHEVEAYTHEACDIGNRDHVGRLYGEAQHKKLHGPRVPDAIINCAGVTNRHNIQGMVLSNGLGPHNLANLGIRLIHMSTDCVFSGRELRGDTFQHPLNTTDYPDPIDVYGRSKLLGEYDQKREHVTVVRGSFIDPHGGFLHWLVNASGTVDAWMRAYWNGTSARHMAGHLIDLAEDPPEKRIVHVAAHEDVSKAWMIEWFVEQLDLPRIKTVRLVNDPQIWRVLEPDIETVPVVEMCNELIKEMRDDS